MVIWSAIRSKIHKVSSHGLVRYLSTPRRMEGKVAVITGGASGIGRATTDLFVENGARVVIADVQDERGREMEREMGENIQYVHCDVREEEQVARAVNMAKEHYGRLDVMFNNAGIAGPMEGKIAEMDMDDFDRVMAVNVRGMVLGTKHAARVMMMDGGAEGGGGGCILCTASITGVLGGVAPHAYSISKFAIPGLVKSAAAELSKHGIRVNCISPFAIATPFTIADLKTMIPGISESDVIEMFRRAGELRGPACNATDIAKAALYLASDDGRYVSGHNLVVDGGFTVIKTFPLSPP